MHSEFVMNRCPDHSLLEAYYDAQLSAAQSSEVEAHLASCASCAQALADMRSVSARFDELMAVDLPAGMLDRLHSKVDSWRSSDTAILPLVRSLIGIAAAILIVASVALAEIRRAPVSAPQAWEGALVLPQDASQQLQSNEAIEPEIIVADLSRRSGR